MEKSDVQVDAVRLEAALGHKQELTRGFGLFSLTALGIIIAKYVHFRFSFFLSARRPDLASQFLGCNRRHDRYSSLQWRAHGCPLRIDRG